MKILYGHYVDDNNNKWNCDIYTKEQAIKNSKSLVECFNCTNCSYCSYCRNCSDCRNCIDCSGCRNCTDCSDCSDCRNCSDCSGCRNCGDWKENPQRYVTGKIGSRKSQTNFYFDKKRVQVMCGCFNGTLKEFKKAVQETHKNNKHGKIYKKEIKLVEYLIKNIL